jgi:D-arginine dehydrogenase
MAVHGGSTADVIVVGGGVAGLSVAAALPANLRVVLLEQELELSRHASGENAAIFRPLEHDHTSATLALRSAELLASFGAAPVLRQTGLLLVAAEREPIALLAAHAESQGLRCESLSHDELVARDSDLAHGEAQHGLFLPQGGVFDVHALSRVLAGVAESHGVELRRSAKVRRVLVAADRVTGVELQDGMTLSAAHVVLAAGAWGQALGHACGASLPMTSLRRHLVALRSEAPPRPRPVVWRIDHDEVYFRADGPGLLGSPCDEDARTPERCETEPSAAQHFAAKLARLSPRLSERCQVARSWACLRTFAPDREIFAGTDPRLPGLSWLAALGGRGMSIAPAAGEWVARALLGEPLHPLAARVAVSRLE